MLPDEFPSDAPEYRLLPDGSLTFSEITGRELASIDWFRRRKVYSSELLTGNFCSGKKQKHIKRKKFHNL